MTKLSPLAIVVILGLLLCLTGSDVLAQRVTFPMIFENITPVGTKNFQFTFSADPAGTDSLDTDLGEREIPDIPLPGDIFYVWTVAPLETSMWLSPSDVREYARGEKSLVEYDVHVAWNGGRLEIIWRQPIPLQIDSIYVIDGFSDWPDNFIKVKVEQGVKLETDNPAFDKFKVLIWYNGITTSVQQARDVPAPRVFPNPATDRIMISDVPVGTTSYSVFDSFGRVVDQGTTPFDLVEIETTQWPSGYYVIRLSDNRSIVYSLPCIKQ